MTVSTLIESALSKVDDEIAVIRGWSEYRLTVDAERCADLLASNGVMLWWTNAELARQRRHAGKPLNGCDGLEADPDEVIAALPRALAILALRRHGVEFDTMHICADRHGGRCERGRVSFPSQPDEDGIKNRGATFTPRALTETVTHGALEPLVYYPGPLETADRERWRLRTPDEILGKTVADIAVGCGVFPLAALRYLTDRILDQAPAGWRVRHTRDIYVSVVSRCLYGVDIHPGSIAITRLVMALMVPLVDIDVQIYRHFRLGDSLLGVTSLDQIRWMHMDPACGKELHQSQPIPDEWLEPAC